MESRPGAGTLVGTNVVAKSAPDGYMLGQLYLSQYSNVFNKDGPADPLQHFEIIGANWIAPFVLSVNNETSKAKTLANEVQSYFGTVGGAAANMKTGKVVVLGVADERRMPALPDVPTMAEQGYPVKAYLTGTVYAPAGVPKNVVAMLEPIVREAVVSPEMEKLLLLQRGRALTVTREENAKILRDEIAFWREAARQNNYQPQ